MNILPRMTMYNHLDCCRCNPEHFGDFSASVSARVPQAPDFSHLIDCENRPVSPPQVFGSRNGFQMVRIDTSPVSTQVIDLTALRDRADQPLIENTVRERGLRVYAYRSVAARCNRLSPLPAAGVLVDNIVFWTRRIFCSLMSRNVSERLSPDRASGGIRLGRKPCLLTASTHAQARRVGLFDCIRSRSSARAAHLVSASDLSPARLASVFFGAHSGHPIPLSAFLARSVRTLVAAVGIDVSTKIFKREVSFASATKAGRLGVHLGVTPTQSFRGAVPRDVGSIAGAFASSNYTPFHNITSARGVTP